MTEPQGLHPPFVEKSEEKRMGALEYRRILHANGGDSIDVEESTIVDLLGRDPPGSQPIALLAKQSVEIVVRRRDPRRAVQVDEHRFESRVYRRRFGQKAPQAPLDHL